MKPQQVVPPNTEELQDFCLGKADPQRALEIEAYLAANSEATPLLEPAPQDVLLGHLHGARELAELRTTLPCIPGYEVLAELGRGGMGVVYQARQLALNRLVALKMILAGGHAAAADLSRFRQEAETGASLQHPNIVQVYEVSDHQGVPYLALEYVAGGTLAQQMGGVPAPQPTAVDLLELLARAVDYAHRQGVLHRDLKPANVLLTDTGVPKLSDFGLARRLGNVQGMTMTGAILGTPGYLAPEQASGQAANLGPRTDVYGLGAILYYLLTGRPPVEAATLGEVIRRTQECDPVRPALLRPGVARDLETICLKCLRKDPLGRYPTALALADDLRRFRLGEPIVARPVGRIERGWRWCRRNPAVALSSAAAVLLLVLVTVVSVLFALEQRSAANTLQTEKETTERTANQLRIETNRVQAALKQARSNEALLLGDRAIRICEEGEDGQVADPSRGLLWLARAVALAPEDDDHLQHVLRSNWVAWQALVCPVQGMLTIPQSSLRRFAVWSPDGKQVLVGRDQGLEIWEVRGWRPGPTLPLPGKCVAVAWSPDNRRVACCGPAGEPIRIWNLQDRSVRTVQPPDVVNDLNFSGDSKQLAAACENREVHFWDAASAAPLGQPLTLSERVTSVAFHPRNGRFLTTTPSVLQQWSAKRKPIGPGLSPDKGLRYASYSGDGKHFSVTGNLPGQSTRCAVYVTATGRLAGPLSANVALHSLHLSPDAQWVVVGTSACRAEVWETAGLSVRFTIAGHQHEVVTAAFRPDGRAVLTASRDGRVRLSALPEGSSPRTFAVPVSEPAHQLNKPFFTTDGLRCLAVSPNGQWLFVGGWDETGWLLHALDGSLKGKITGHNRVITAAAFTPDGRGLLTGSVDLTVSLWEVGTWRRLQGPWPFPNPVRYFAFSPDGSLAIVGGRTAAWLLRLGGSGGMEDNELWRPSRSGVFLRDGQGVLFGKEFGVQRWDVATRQVTDLPLPHTSSVSAVGVDPEGRRVATGAYGVGQIWDLRTGNPIGPPLQQKDERFKSMTFSPDGRLVASLTFKGTARFWDAATGRSVGPVLKHPGVGNALVFHPDGSTLLTSSSDALVRRWRVPRPVREQAPRLKLRTEVLTGMELDAEGVVRVLPVEVWRQRRQQLEQQVPGTVPYLEPEQARAPGTMRGGHD